MRWRGGRRSSNVIDARGRRGGGGGRIGMPRGGRARLGGVGGLGLVAILVIGWLFGVDLTPLLGGSQGGGFAPQASQQVTAADEERGAFASTVLAFTEDVWGEVYPAQTGQPYEPPQLVLFKGAVQSGCGGATAQSGPFYCPADERAYLDTDFFVTMERRLGAGGDFAAAYVIAHEVAHHIQNEMGTLGAASRARAAGTEVEANAITVRLELQADCYAGIWARYAGDRFGVLEPGDLDEALNAARMIGDDHLAREAGRTVQPHTFTHGTSAQRQRWFARGYETGDMSRCDTFGAATL